MSELDEQGRPRPPSNAGEVDTLVGFLDFQRATFEWKCRGLSAAQLQRRVGASTMTLGGMLKHLAFVEDYWFSYWWRGTPLPAPWRDVDWDQSPNWEWDRAAHEEPDELFRQWHDAVSRARDVVRADLALGTLDDLAQRTEEGESPTRRWMLCHMIEEYARHCGHADLLRESIDGETGE
ncbi:MAG TPA: DinB family protein [Acidimicrobiales bacterium]|jgi:uncharacterized damage-inducible protein DinB